MTIQQIYNEQLKILKALQQYRDCPEYSYIETKIKDICRELTDILIKEANKAI